MTFQTSRYLSPVAIVIPFIQVTNG